MFLVKRNTSFTFSSLTCSQLYAFTDISFFNKIKYQFLLARCAQVGSWGGRLSRAERVSPPACGSRCRGPLAAAQLARAASPAPAPGTGRAPQQQLLPVCGVRRLRRLPPAQAPRLRSAASVPVSHVPASSQPLRAPWWAGACPPNTAPGCDACAVPARILF